MEKNLDYYEKKSPLSVAQLKEEGYLTYPELADLMKQKVKEGVWKSKSSRIDSSYCHQLGIWGRLPHGCGGYILECIIAEDGHKMVKVSDTVHPKSKPRGKTRGKKVISKPSKVPSLFEE